jgi:imidazole glycerol-phosphate synthase subunit HisF
MLRPRIIPCLLVQDRGLVKTIQFGDPKYVGDPLNAVRIFNEKEVDELMVLDIDATRKRIEPNYTLIEHLAMECRMPLCYGGGIASPEQAQRIVQLGVEKVAVSAAAVNNPGVIADMARHLGSQSVVVVIDVRRLPDGSYGVFTHNGTRPSSRDPVEFAVEMQGRGAGEVVLNSIDNDGMMKGYDVELVDRVTESITVPVTVLGGAGSLEDIRALVARYGIIGAAAGSLFVFKGVYRAVLINYPRPADKLEVLAAASAVAGGEPTAAAAGT